MISELNDSEILNFLMTSDFDQDYKPEEYKYLLLKWRYFYRILNGKFENYKTDKEFVIKKLEEGEESLKSSLLIQQSENVKKNDIINRIKERKLTLRERVGGKIILNDENHGIQKTGKKDK